MPPRLILNADDFGLTPGINRAIAQLHDAHALTSATLMASGPAFHDAVALALARPTLGVGCHIVLTDGTPILPPSQIPTLCPGGRNFRPQLTTFARDLLLGRIDEADIHREALAQIHRLQSAGLRLTHADTHKHTHLFPAVARPVLRALLDSGVHAIRNPFEPSWAVRTGHNLRRRLMVTAFATLRRRFLAMPPIASGQIRTTQGTIGVSATGDLNSTSLQSLLDRIPPGAWELVCHPGYNDPDLGRITTRLRREREIELHALLASIPNLPTAQLIHYGNLEAYP
jgi:predicted glycoside hydrolase/deacetylase ChbG (UPF0249 family)